MGLPPRRVGALRPQGRLPCRLRRPWKRSGLPTPCQYGHGKRSVPCTDYTSDTFSGVSTSHLPLLCSSGGRVRRCRRTPTSFGENSLRQFRPGSPRVCVDVAPTRSSCRTVYSPRSVSPSARTEVETFTDLVRLGNSVLRPRTRFRTRNLLCPTLPNRPCTEENPHCFHGSLTHQHNQCVVTPTRFPVESHVTFYRCHHLNRLKIVLLLLDRDLGRRERVNSRVEAFVSGHTSVVREAKLHTQKPTV